MRRRTFLATVSFGAGAGCVGGSEGDGSATTAIDGTETTSAVAPSQGDSTGEWPMNGRGPGRTGYAPTARFGDEVTEAWSAESVEDDASWTTAPVTDDRRVFVGSSVERARVTAYRANGGGRSWRTELGVDDERITGLAVAEGRVYATTRIDGSRTSRLVGVSTSDGALDWETTFPANATGLPLVADGRLYVATGGDDGAVVACALDGTRQWRRTIDGEPYTPLCFESGTLFAGTASGDIAALDAEDGEPLWTSGAVTGDACCPDIQGSPTTSDGRLYVPGIDERLYAVATDDGSVEWTAELLENDYGNAIPSPAVADETVYVNTIHGGVIAFDTADGSERWRTGEYGGNLPPAAGADGVVCPRTDASIAAYDSAGDERWRFEMHRPDAPGMALYSMRPRVAAAHGRVYVTVNDGRVYALDPSE